jgi:hypothetical protein
MCLSNRNQSILFAIELPVLGQPTHSSDDLRAPSRCTLASTKGRSGRTDPSYDFIDKQAERLRRVLSTPLDHHTRAAGSVAPHRSSP